LVRIVLPEAHWAQFVHVELVERAVPAAGTRPALVHSNIVPHGPIAADGPALDELEAEISQCRVTQAVAMAISAPLASSGGGVTAVPMIIVMTVGSTGSLISFLVIARPQNVSAQ
jgi:hypothetical protein